MKLHLIPLGSGDEISATVNLINRVCAFMDSRDYPVEYRAAVARVIADSGSEGEGNEVPPNSPLFAGLMAIGYFDYPYLSIQKALGLYFILDQIRTNHENKN